MDFYSFCPSCHNTERSRLGRGVKKNRWGEPHPASGLKCAKRTQFAGVNCAKRTQFPATPGGTGPPGPWDEGRLCKTNPISPECQGMGEGGRGRRGRSVQDEPNFGPAWAGPGLQWAKDAKRTQFGGVKCAKRSQSGSAGLACEGKSCETNPIPAGRARRGLRGGGRLCETNPIWGNPAGVRGAVVQNAPNFARAPGNGRGRPGPGGSAGTNGAKRTQFRGVGQRVQYSSFHCSIIPPSQSDANRAKRSQSLDCGFRIADWGKPAVGRLPSNLPFQACAGRLYKQTQLGGAHCAKRSQFGSLHLRYDGAADCLFLSPRVVSILDRHRQPKNRNGKE